MKQRWLGNHGHNSGNSRVQGTRQNSAAQKVRDRRRQEADGFGVTGSSNLAYFRGSQRHSCLQVGSSSIGCCTVGSVGKPTPNRDGHFTPSTYIYSRSKRKAGSENEIKTIPFTIASNKITEVNLMKKVCNLYREN